MSDTHNHLEQLTEKWNEVPNWTVLESWKGKGKESNNFYFKIYEDRAGEYAPFYCLEEDKKESRTFIYCATRTKDRKGYIFHLKEIDIAPQLVGSEK
jgi:hypothetical protein